MDNEIVIDVDADVRLSFSSQGDGVILITPYGNIRVTPQEFLFYRCLFKITDIGNIGKLPVHCPSLSYLLRRTLLTAEHIEAILSIAIGAVNGLYKTSQQENKEFDNNEEETFLSLHQFLLCCKMVGQLQRIPDAPADHTLLVAMNFAYENELNSIGNNATTLPHSVTSSSSSSSVAVPLTSTSFANFSLGISPLTMMMPSRHRTWTSKVHGDDDGGADTVETEVLRAKVCGWELSNEAFQKQYIRFKVVTRVESVRSSIPTIRHPQTSIIEQFYIQSACKMTTPSSTDSLSSAASSSSSNRTTGTGTGTSPDHDNNHLTVSIPSHFIGDSTARTTLPITAAALSVVSLGANAKKKKKSKKGKAESEKEEKSVPASPLPILPPPRNNAVPLLSPVLSEGPWPNSPSPVSTPTPSQQPMLVATSSPILVQEATAYRRYKDFEALVILLRRLYKGTVIPPLPPKDWTTSFQQQTLPSEIFANQRLLELQCFVDALMAHPVLGKSYEVRAFFLASPPGLKAFKTTLAHLQVDVDTGALLPVMNSSQSSLSLASWPTVLPGGAAGVRTLTAATGKAVQAATSSAVGLVSVLWEMGSAAVGKTRESFAPTTLVGSKEPAMSCGNSDDSFEEVERPPFPTPTRTTNPPTSSPCTTHTNSMDITAMDPGNRITNTSNPTNGLTTLSVIKSMATIGTESNGKHGVLDRHPYGRANPYGRAKNSNTTNNLFSTFMRNAREVASVGLLHVKLATASAATSSSSRLPDHRGKSDGESPGTCSDNDISAIAKGPDSTPLASPSTPVSLATTTSSLEASLFEVLRYLKIVHSLGETLQALTRNDGRRIFELSQLAHAMQQGSGELSLGSATVRRTVICFTEGSGCVAELQHNHYEMINRDVVTPVRFLGRYLESAEKVVQQKKDVAKTLTAAMMEERKKKHALDAVRMVDAAASSPPLPTVGGDAATATAATMSTLARCTEALTLAQTQVSFAVREEHRVSLSLRSEANSLLSFTTATTDSNSTVSGHKKLLLEHLVKLTTCRASSHGSAAASWEALHRDLLSVLDKDDFKDDDDSQPKQQVNSKKTIRQQQTTSKGVENSMAFSNFL